MTRRAAAVLVAAFVLTRVPLAWLADHPERYGPADTKVTGDVDLYAYWAAEIVSRRRAPYSEVAIEYPPGSLPFVAAPALSPALAGTYRQRFIALMVVVDAAGLAGVAAIGRARGRARGAWLWLASVPLLGPLALLRLDLVPAAATVWALERAARRRSLATGAWLGFAALAKLYAALLLPLAWLAAPDRRRLAAGAACLVVVPLLLLSGSVGDVWTAVLGYHAARGIQVESTPGALLLAASHAGHPVSVAYNFGAFHVAAPGADALEGAASLLSAGALGAATWLGARLVPRGRAGPLAAAAFATLAGVVALGTVLSPQFLLWLLAPAAAAAAFRDGLRRSVLVIPLAAALSHALYPYLYNDLLTAQPFPVAVLVVRNALIAAAAVAAWVELARAREGRPTPSSSRAPARRQLAAPRGAPGRPTSSPSGTSAGGGSTRNPRTPRRRST